MRPEPQGSIPLFDRTHPLRLDCGATLPSVTAAYESWGRLDEAGTNAILVCHALTGNAHAAGEPGSPGWWQGLIGPGKGLDTDRYFVIASNFLGGCYGTTGPTSIDPDTGEPYRDRFPRVSVRDMVRVQHRLLEHLGVRRLRTVIGGSLGGMQVLEWAVMYPGMVDTIIPIGTSLAHSAWAIGWNEAARLAIMADSDWQGGRYTRQPERGLGLARIIAMISYRSAPSFQGKFAREVRAAPGGNLFEVESYLRYQGQKLVQRFDANTYITITRAMDGHDIEAGRGPARAILRGNPVRCLSTGIDSDVLYPVAEQKEIASAFPLGSYAEIHSPHGHDAFLIEYDQLNSLVSEFLERKD